LALLTSVTRGILYARQVDAVFLAAWWSLLVFALVGGVIGWVAGRVVEESVKTTLAAQLTAEKAPETPASQNP